MSEEMDNTENMTPRRRGRPPKNAVMESPTDIIGADDTGAAPIKERKKRAPKTSEPAFDKAAMAKKLQGWHQLAAMLLRTPELALDYDEAEMLVNDVENLTREYGISLTGKTAAWLGLAGSAAMIYAPRAMLVMSKIQQAKAQKIPQPPQGVI